ncbi:hypothetical protein M5K25_018850 [Dendrobium thyrsiflorum]|uniref:Uncharacterized protein n=1 Tax=Dendrobium thyrsiflorum TaxID=117978 RepID=A0ABD0UD85_DENTH
MAGSVKFSPLLVACNTLSSQSLILLLDGSKLLLISWKATCKPIPLGGLGIPYIPDLIFAYHYALIWRMLTSESLLAMFWKMKYISFWINNNCNTTSNWWKALRVYWEKMEPDIHLKVWNSCAFSFIWDP